MYPQLLEQLLAEDESAYLEFKEAVEVESKEGKLKFLKDVRALANSTTQNHRSYLIIGVEDKTKKIVGVKNLSEEQLQQLIGEHCKPPIGFDFKVIQKDSLPVGIIQFFHSNLKPHTLKRKISYQITPSGKYHEIRENQVFLRRGSVVGEAEVDEILAMAQNRESAIEQRSQMVNRLEAIGTSIDDTSYYLREISQQVSRGHVRKSQDRVVEGIFVSMVSGMLLAWLFGSAWPYSLVTTPLLVFIAGVVASVFRIVNFGITRALVNALTLGFAIALLFKFGIATRVLEQFLRDSPTLLIFYGAVVGVVAGTIMSFILQHYEQRARG